MKRFSGRSSKPNAKGRDGERVGRSERSLIIRRSLWQSPHISALSVTARALMVELTSMFNGSNNGAIFLSHSDAADRLGLSDRAAVRRAFDELLGTGLLTITAPGYFRVKAGAARANSYRINWVDEDGKPRSAEGLPSLDYAILPERARVRLAKRAKALKAYVRDAAKEKSAGQETLHSPPLIVRSGAKSSIFGGKAGQESSPGYSGMHAFSPFGGQQESCLHILHHRGNGDLRCPSCLNLFRCDRPNRLFCSEKCRRAAEYRRTKTKHGWWASLQPIVMRVSPREAKGSHQ